MMRIILIVFLILASISVYAAMPPQSEGLCVAPETAFFACQTGDKKWICLCGQLPKKLQYRFGAQDREELRFPEESIGGVDRFRFAHYSRFQTERVEVAFSTHDVDYFIFDYTEHSEHQAGVRVAPHGGTERVHVCSGQITSSLTELKKSIRCDSDNALNGGNCP